MISAEPGGHENKGQTLCIVYKVLVPRANAGYLFVGENGLDLGPNDGRGLGSIDRVEDALLAIVVDEGRGHGVVRGKALLERVCVVVRALHKRLAGDLFRERVGESGLEVADARGRGDHEFRSRVLGSDRNIRTVGSVDDMCLFE